MYICWVLWLLIRTTHKVYNVKFAKQLTRLLREHPGYWPQLGLWTTLILELTHRAVELVCLWPSCNSILLLLLLTITALMCVTQWRAGSLLTSTSTLRQTRAAQNCSERLHNAVHMASNLVLQGQVHDLARQKLRVKNNLACHLCKTREVLGEGTTICNFARLVGRMPRRRWNRTENMKIQTSRIRAPVRWKEKEYCKVSSFSADTYEGMLISGFYW